jgi:hypothetical integral membrane protein (TIGR02206 family)
MFENRTIVRYILGFLIFLQEITYYVWHYAHHTLSVQNAILLHLCGAILIFIWLFTIKPNKYFFEIIFYWGFVGGPIALGVPNFEGYHFPQYIVFQYYISHILLMVFCIFLLVAYKEYVITWGSQIRVFIFTICLGAISVIVNKIYGTNYLFLNGNLSDGVKSPLDFMSQNVFIRSLELGVLFFAYITILTVLYKVISSCIQTKKVK